MKMLHALPLCIVIVSSGTNGDWSEKYWHEIEHCKGQIHTEDGSHHHLKTDHVMYEGPVMTMTKGGKVVPFFVQSLGDAKRACARLGMSGKMACYFIPE